MKKFLSSIVMAAAFCMPTMAQDVLNYALPDYEGVDVKMIGDLDSNDWFHAGKANDNDFETKWLSCDAKGYENQWTKHYLIADLGVEREISEIDIYWQETANIYAVCLTNDEDVVTKAKAERGKEEAVPSNIGEVVASTNYHDLGMVAEKPETHKYPLAEPKKARFVVVFTSKDWIADTGYGVGINELQVWGPSTTTNVISDINTTKTNKIYDLQGREVKTAQKGLYIVNGKKVVK